MKRFAIATLSSIVCILQPLAAISVGSVNVRQCVEQSKVGKNEQSQFDQLRKQLEQALEMKEKELNELAPKLNEEYLDTLTPEAERELKEKFNLLSQEMSIQQNQYYQTLNQANFQLTQKLFEMIQEASKKVAETKKIDLILNDESCFYKKESIDISKEIIQELDAAFDAAQKK